MIIVVLATTIMLSIENILTDVQQNLRSRCPTARAERS